MKHKNVATKITSIGDSEFQYKKCGKRISTQVFPLYLKQNGTQVKLKHEFIYICHHSTLLFPPSIKEFGMLYL